VAARGGDLRETPLPEVVRDLLFDRADGVLSVAAAARTDVYFDRGDVFYCRSDAPEQRLEALLVRWGLVAAPAVPALVARAGRDVRGTLVKEGVFPSAEAFDEFMAQILRERVMDLFTLEAGPWTFEPKDVRAMRQLAFPSTTPNVILEGARRLAGAERLLAPLVGDDPALQLNDRPAIRVEALQMSPTEGYVMSMVTGTTPVSEVARVSPLGKGETVRLLYALLVLDVLRHPSFVGHRFSLSFLAERSAAEQKRDKAERARVEAEYQRVRGIDLFQILEGGATMRPDDLRTAVKSYQEQWTPEKFSPRIAKEQREQLLLIAGRASELLLAAMDADRKQRQADSEAAASGEGEGGFKRMELSKSSAQEKKDREATQAQEHFRRACEAFRGKDYHHAVEFTREAIRLNETAEYQALLGDALSMNPLWGKRAEEAYLRAMQLDHFDPRLPLVLGRIYAKAGLKARAKEMFEKSLDIQADFEDAKAALKELKRS
jgi:tetratricopeptide (TPR) repeat protein